MMTVSSEMEQRKNWKCRRRQLAQARKDTSHVHVRCLRGRALERRLPKSCLVESLAVAHRLPLIDDCSSECLQQAGAGDALKCLG